MAKLMKEWSFMVLEKFSMRETELISIGTCEDAFMRLVIKATKALNEKSAST
jgi:hypothetical protein